MRGALLCSGLVLGACAPSSNEGPGATEPPAIDGTDVPPGWRAPSGPCALDPEDPRRLVVTTTDFATGAVTVVDLGDGTVEPDVAPGSTDAIPFGDRDRVALVHRHGIDRLDVLDATSWALHAQVSIDGDGPSPNPHGVAFADGLAFVTTFAEPELRIVDPERPPAEAHQGRIDLGELADEDGNPEASQIVACGDLLVVTLQRLDSGYRPVATDQLVLVDPRARAPLELDPDREHPAGLPLHGQWVRQLRRDPADEGGLTLLGLSTGIERIDLRTGIRTWALPPEAMDAAGIGEPFQPQAFDVADDGTTAYLAAYDADFSQVRLYRAGLDGAEPSVPEPFADGFDSAERTLELVGDSLWYGSRRVGEPGLWRFDVGAVPPVAVAGPLSTGLPPYSMVAIP